MEGLNVSVKLAAKAAWIQKEEGDSPRPDRGELPLPRRMGLLTRAVFSCVMELKKQYGEAVYGLPIVYSSRYGEIRRTLGLFDELGKYGDMSPASFSLSVHNATASLLSEKTSNHERCICLSAAEHSPEMGLLEAALQAQEGPVLYIYADEFPDYLGMKPCAAVAVVEAAAEPRPLAELCKELMPTC